ncbi:hypothetical protein [Paenibacillus humicus]|uniref:hypothetical protein n=1 Tax=Paenibacillus humicus TaxID=412861 RepID=UPI003D2CDB08
MGSVGHRVTPYVLDAAVGVKWIDVQLTGFGEQTDWIGAQLTEWTVDPLFCEKAAKTNAYGQWFRYLAK